MNVMVKEDVYDDYSHIIIMTFAKKQQTWYQVKIIIIDIGHVHPRE